MKNSMVFILLLFFGCADPEENAAANLKKGDNFFGKQEYEVAEYYYEKVPEDSPMYPQAQKKLSEIALIKRHWVEKEVPAQDVPKIKILNQSFGVDNVRHVPAHTLELYNYLDRNVEYVTVEFTYTDGQGAIVGRLTTDVHISLYPNSRGTFSGIEPGYVDKKFASSTASIIKARFQ